MPKLHIPADTVRIAKEARKTLVAEAKSKANCTNKEIKDLIVALFEEIQDLKEQLVSQ